MATVSAGSLVGREAELAAIDELIAKVQAGTGAAGFVEAPAGMGKTTLMSAAAAGAAASGFEVLRAAGSWLEGDYAFGVVRQLFGHVVTPGRGSEELLDGAAGLAAVPLGMAVASGNAASWGDPVSAAMHGLYWLVARLAERAPLLIAVDDAHWADAMSLRFLLYLERRLDDLPVLALVASRPVAEQRDPELLAALTATDGVTILRPAPLAEPQVAEVIRHRSGPDPPDALIRAWHRASGGNPFLLSELIADHRPVGRGQRPLDVERAGDVAPARVVRWLSARLMTLGDGAQRLARAYSVLGPETPLIDAAELSQLEPSAATVAADVLIGAGILAAGPTYDFVHPLVRSAVYEQLPPAQRAEAHARAARITASRNGPAAVVAAHLLLVAPGRDSWTVEALKDAAVGASASGARQSAAVYLERALQEATSRQVRAELLLELGEAELDAARPGATDRLREALELISDPRTRAETWLRLGRALFAVGDFEGARDAFGRGLGERDGVDDDLYLELRAWYVTDTRHDTPLPEAVTAWMDALFDGDAPARTRTERLLLAQRAYHLARSGERPHHDVVLLARRALAHGALLLESGRDWGPFSAATFALVAGGDPDGAITELDHAIELSQRSGSRVAFGWFSHLRGMAHCARGHLLDAIADLEAARREFTDGSGNPLPDTRAMLALCLIDREDLSAAADALRSDHAPHTPEPRMSCAYVYALGRLKAAHGDLAAGLDTLLECATWIRDGNSPNPAANVAWRSDAALLAARLGKTEQAHTLLSEELEIARAFGASSALAYALRAAALIDNGDACHMLFDEAVSVVDGTPATLQLARVLVDQGAALRRSGRRRDAIGPLRRGLDLATQCGATAISRYARDELITAGARPRRERTTGRDALTPSELRLAHMAADGKSNPQIAEALFITRKTVTAHLTHIYQKLNIESRSQLADALADQKVGTAYPA